MALARLSIKTAEVGKAKGHLEYITRQGIYAKSGEKSHELKHYESGNLPKFTENNSLNFWQAVDKNERNNGTAYREMEIALPRELSREKQINLVREWVNQELGELHAYTWALHEANSADGGLNPHVHLMFSERRNDGIEREAEQYFKRYNSKNPEKGGARKGYGENFTKKFAHKERAEELQQLRERWEQIVNKHLELAGCEERINMKSYKERGINIEPEKKQLPSQWRKKAVKQQILEDRENKIKYLELEKLEDEKNQLITNTERQIKQLKKDNLNDELLQGANEFIRSVKNEERIKKEIEKQKKLKQQQETERLRKLRNENYRGFSL